MDHPLVSQSVTTKQLGEALRQVQETLIQGVCEKMKALERQPKPMWGFEYEPTPEYTTLYQQNRNRSLKAEPTPVARIVEAKQALQRIQVSMLPSRPITSPHASRSKGVAWCEG